MTSNGSGPEGTFEGGALVVSLDFELHWGVREFLSVDAYRKELLGAREAVVRMLERFEAYGIRATWATVGLLFAASRQEAIDHAPGALPQYHDPTLNPYVELESVGEDEDADPFHFAPSLIARIAQTPGQEVATHTYSHFFCLDAAYDPAAFRGDLEAALKLAALRDVTIRSIVFPKNQVDRRYLDICSELGLVAFRGHEPSPLHRPLARESERPLRRALRLADAYVNVTAVQDHPAPLTRHGSLVNVPASRYLRRYTPPLRALEPVRRRRVKEDLTHAAANNRLYHLWWHPHDMGGNLGEAFRTLDEILDHYAHLRDTRGMRSLSMIDLAQS